MNKFKELKRIRIESASDLAIITYNVYNRDKGHAWCVFVDANDVGYTHPYIFVHGTPGGKVMWEGKLVDAGEFLNNAIPKELVGQMKEITFISCYGYFFNEGTWHGIPVRNINPDCPTQIAVKVEDQCVVVGKDNGGIPKTSFKLNYQDLQLKWVVKPVVELYRKLGICKKPEIKVYG